MVGGDLRCACISDSQADRPDAKLLPGLDEGGSLGIETEAKKCESPLPTRREQVEAQPVQSDGQTDTSAITNEMVEDYRRRLFRIYLEHAPGHIGRIPALLQEHGSTKASLDALVARALWEHLAKGSGDCPSGVLMQPTLDVSSDSAGTSEGIDAEVGRAEADKELTFERRSVGGEPQYSDKHLEWISSQKTTYLRERTGQWTVCEDMASLTEWQTLDPSRVERAVTVMVPTQWYVNGEAYYAMTALPSVEAENLGILTRKERKMVDRGLEQPVRHDETLWSSIRGNRPSFFLGQLARDMDVAVSFSNNQIHEARTREDREEKDSPRIVIYRSPSHTQHPWRLGRREVPFRQREEMEAQLQWLISSVRQRLAKGCLVLVRYVVRRAGCAVRAVRCRGQCHW